ncbi:hypothetical protein KC330_g200 [Hortaea werneckii]|nr:hypothetical protein KC330_g200 [Hortaea werneckii]
MTGVIVSHSLKPIAAIPFAVVKSYGASSAATSVPVGPFSSFESWLLSISLASHVEIVIASCTSAASFPVLDLEHVVSLAVR